MKMEMAFITSKLNDVNKITNYRYTKIQIIKYLTLLITFAICR